MPSIRTLGIEVVKTSGAEELVLCPFHDDTKPSAWYNPKKNLFYCAVCNKGMTYRQVAYALGVAIEDEETIFDEDPMDDFDLMEDSELLNIGIDKYHFDYMSNRNVSEKTAKHYGVRWKTSKPEAIVLPVTDVREHVIGVCYRYIWPHETGSRYKKLGKTTPIWPMHLLRSFPENDVVIVTEGAFSAMRISSYCEEYAKSPGSIVALLGAKANQKVVDTLSGFSPIFIYDNDDAGRNACRKMRSLAPHAYSFVVPVSPDDMTDKQVKEFFIKLNNKITKREHELLSV